MPKVDSFDKNVDRYESWFDLNRTVYESELEAVRDLLPKFEKGLEVGVGTGRFAAPIGIHFGIDPSINMGKVASKRGIKMIQGVGESLPFKDGILDLVLMVTTICFLEDVPGTLKESYRVLTAGGYLLIGFIDRESSFGKFYKTHKTDNVYYKNATFLSTIEVVYCLNQAGFKDIQFNQTNFQDPEGMKFADPVKPGLEAGAFAVVRGIKPLLSKP